MKKQGLFVGVVRVALSFALLWSSMFCGVQVVHAKRATGEFSGRTYPSNIFFSPQATSWQMDQAGTLWNTVDDLDKRMFMRREVPTNQVSVTVPANGAASTWTIAVNTNTVAADRFSVRILNPKSNTQQFNVGVATTASGGVAGAVQFPSTGTFLITLLPGEAFEQQASTSCHFVVMSTGTIGTETAKVTEWGN